MHGTPGVEPGLLQPRGALSGDVLEVSGVAPDHAADADDRVDATLREGLGRDRDLERARHPCLGDARGVHPDRGKATPYAVEEADRHVVVEPPTDDRDAQPPAVERRLGPAVVDDVGRHQEPLSTGSPVAPPMRWPMRSRLVRK